MPDRDALGRVVRDARIRWAKRQPHPDPSSLVPYDDLSEDEAEAERQIGEAVRDYLAVQDDPFGSDDWI